MNYPLRIVSKIGAVVQEQVARSPWSSLVANKIRGNYILMYHGISADEPNLFNRRHLSQKYFIRQIKFLKKHFGIISLDDYFSGNYDYERSNFILTFDDGFLNNYLYAKPILERYKVPGTFFMTGLNNIGDTILWADYLNIASLLTSDDVEIEGELFTKRNETYYSSERGKSIYDIIRYEQSDYDYKRKVKEAFDKHVSFKKELEFKDYWQLMTDEQIREMAASPFITVGSHGYFHNNLGSIAHEQAVQELTQSKNYLENLTQQKINKLAYPDGSYTVRLIQQAHDMGYDIQLAADISRCNESGRNRYIQRRHGIYSVDSCLNQIINSIKN